jgi:hypothetical protein
MFSRGGSVTCNEHRGKWCMQSSNNNNKKRFSTFVFKHRFTNVITRTVLSCNTCRVLHIANFWAVTFLPLLHNKRRIRTSKPNGVISWQFRVRLQSYAGTNDFSETKRLRFPAHHNALIVKMFYDVLIEFSRHCNLVIKEFLWRHRHSVTAVLHCTLQDMSQLESFANQRTWDCIDLHMVASSSEGSSHNYINLKT